MNIIIKTLHPLSIIAFILFGIFSFGSFASASETDGTIDPVYRYAWGENIGWIDFGTTNGNVHITDSGLTGYALGETTGWISLGNVDNDGSGNLSGYAWGENIGWINFNPLNGGVVINSSGEFTGSALSDTAGWIIFDGDYKVKTDYRPQGIRPACNNSIDDDGDGLTDYPNDPGCASLDDDNEENGYAFISPQKPSISDISITLDEQGEINLGNIPSNITQIAVSTDPNFTDSSWEDISNKDDILSNHSGIIYIKLRTNQGASSDIITYDTNSNEIISDNQYITLDEGDIVKTDSSFDVYIIKYNNNKRYKRLILSPTVFSSYQHLKWENIKIISEEQINLYTTSSLVNVKGDNNIYYLTPDGDTGTKRIVATYDNGILRLTQDDNAGDDKDIDVDSIYEINEVDRDSYDNIQ